MLKRIVLFALVNIGVLLTINVVLQLLGVNRYLTAGGINYQNLMVFCLLYGMGGAFISLLLSKKIVRWTMNLHLIDAQNAGGVEGQLVATVHRLAAAAGLERMPEVAIYESPELNAFATGPSRNNSLVAVSSGMLQRMDRREVEAVLGHEVSHIANGDMVTMTLIQGVVNAFVIFFAKVAAWGIAQAMQRNDDEHSPSFFLVFAIEMVLQVVFGLLGTIVVCWFSRQREFRADSGAARLVGAASMIGALQRLGSVQVESPFERGQETVAALKINGTKGFLALLSTHPSLEERIARLGRSY
jgi:heat shock protein HtpX